MNSGQASSQLWDTVGSPLYSLAIPSQTHMAKKKGKKIPFPSSHLNYYLFFCISVFIVKPSLMIRRVLNLWAFIWFVTYGVRKQTSIFRITLSTETIQSTYSIVWQKKKKIQAADDPIESN